MTTPLRTRLKRLAGPGRARAELGSVVCLPGTVLDKTTKALGVLVRWCFRSLSRKKRKRVALGTSQYLRYCATVSKIAGLLTQVSAHRPQARP